jgi:hypothetical protein
MAREMPVYVSLEEHEELPVSSPRFRKITDAEMPLSRAAELARIVNRTGRPPEFLDLMRAAASDGMLLRVHHHEVDHPKAYYPSSGLPGYATPAMAVEWIVDPASQYEKDTMARDSINRVLRGGLIPFLKEHLHKACT